MDWLSRDKTNKGAVELGQVKESGDGRFAPEKPGRRKFVAGVATLAAAGVAQAMIPEAALAYITPNEQAQGLMRIMTAGTPAHPRLREAVTNIIRGNYKVAKSILYPNWEPADFNTLKLPGIPRDLGQQDPRLYVALFVLDKKDRGAYTASLKPNNDLGLIPPVVGTPNWLFAISLVDPRAVKRFILDKTPGSEPFIDYTREDFMLSAMMGGITGDTNIDVLTNKMYLRDPKTQATVKTWANKHNFRPFGENVDLNSKAAYLINLGRDSNLKNPEVVGLSLLALGDYYKSIGDTQNRDLYLGRINGDLLKNNKIPKYATINKERSVVPPITFFS